MANLAVEKRKPQYHVLRLINPVIKGKSECLRVLEIKFTAIGTELPKTYSTVIDMEYSH